jgi:hypothetical protein
MAMSASGASLAPALPFLTDYLGNASAHSQDQTIAPTPAATVLSEFILTPANSLYIAWRISLIGDERLLSARPWSSVASSIFSVSWISHWLWSYLSCSLRSITPDSYVSISMFSFSHFQPQMPTYSSLSIKNPDWSTKETHFEMWHTPGSLPNCNTIPADRGIRQPPPEEAPSPSQPLSSEPSRQPANFARVLSSVCQMEHLLITPFIQTLLPKLYDNPDSLMAGVCHITKLYLVNSILI